MAADLGYPLGHPVIENILVHCVISVDGFIDFSGAERELARERRLLTASTDNKTDTVYGTRHMTSKPIPNTPWRADVVHNAKMQSERQAKTLQEYQQPVSQKFHQFVSGSVTEQEFVSYIQVRKFLPSYFNTDISCRVLSK